MQPGRFFCELDRFERLARSMLPALARANGRRGVRLWSAECGSGEALWSMVMLVDEARLPAHLEVSFVGTDGDPQQLARAREAVYADHELARVSDARRGRYFVRGSGRHQGLWRVIAPLRDRVELCELELAAPWPAQEAFDVVVCHRPLGLDAASAAPLVRRFADVLVPGGMMLFGDAEPMAVRACVEAVGRGADRKLAR